MNVATRLARDTDIDGIMTLYRDAQQWLRGKGLDQWSARDGDHDDDGLHERVKAGIVRAVKHDECWVVTDGDRLMGSITVDERADPEFWRMDDAPSSALYIHRMMVANEAHGQGVGSILLDIADGAAHKAGKPFLRLDAWRNNPALHAYYVRQGFNHVRTVRLDHRPSGALFERPTRSPTDSRPDPLDTT
jgi:GNAT superfamily N-acetyltransferase